MGGWAVAQSPIMGTTITLSRLKRRGYESLLDYYFKVCPHYQSKQGTAGYAPKQNEGRERSSLTLGWCVRRTGNYMVTSCLLDYAHFSLFISVIYGSLPANTIGNLIILDILLSINSI